MENKNKSEKLKLVFDFIADYLNEDNKVVRTNEKVNNVINGKKSFDEIRLINKLNEIKTRHGKPNINKEIGLTYDEFGNIQTVVSEDDVTPSNETLTTDEPTLTFTYLGESVTLKLSDLPFDFDRSKSVMQLCDKVYGKKNYIDNTMYGKIERNDLDMFEPLTNEQAKDFIASQGNTSTFIIPKPMTSPLQKTKKVTN